VRIVSWNVNGKDIWQDLARDEVDIALLQEATEPSHTDYQVFAGGLGGSWATTGWGYLRATAVAAPSGRFELKHYPTQTHETYELGGLIGSRSGSVSVCDVLENGQVVLTVASIYAAWQSKVDDRKFIFADASAHSILSDLSPLLTSADNHKLVVAGDLNILYGYGEGDVKDPEYWARRYETVFTRAEVLGLNYVGPRHPNGRQPTSDRWPAEMPPDSLCVPTFHSNRGSPDTASRQLDHVFASAPLVDHITVRALNDPAEWGLSDHCRIEIALPG
jgi:exonuclease III